jgi:hypothetical protein
LLSKFEIIFLEILFCGIKKGRNGVKRMGLKGATLTITTRKKCRDPDIV